MEKYLYLDSFRDHVVDNRRFIDFDHIGPDNTEPENIFRRENILPAENIYRNLLLTLDTDIGAIRKRQENFRYFIDNRKVVENLETILDILSKYQSKIKFKDRYIRRKVTDDYGDRREVSFSVCNYDQRKAFKDSLIADIGSIIDIFPDGDIELLKEMKSQLLEAPDKIRSDWKQDDKFIENLTSPFLILARINPQTGELNEIRNYGMLKDWKQNRKEHICIQDDDGMIRRIEFNNDMTHMSGYYPTGKILKETHVNFPKVYDGLDNFRESIVFLPDLIDLCRFYCNVARSAWAYTDKRIPITFPEISSLDEKITHVDKFYPFQLKKIQKIRPVNIYFDGSENLAYYITGLNSRGKSSSLRNLAYIKMRTQAGLFIPAKFAEVSPVEKILVYQTSGDETGASRFRQELKEIAQIYKEADNSCSLLLFDEIGTSTDLSSSTTMLRRCVDYSIANGLQVVFVSHNQEIAKKLEDVKKVKLLRVKLDYNLEDGIGESHGEYIMKEEKFLEL